MSRTAHIHRVTGETDVSLSLALDGTGAGERRTGVGFFDHLLDAVARHGGLDLDVQVQGDLETGPHHTVEDTGLALGQALDEALGDRSGIRRFGHAVVPMDEARASCAIDVSGRPYTALEGSFPAERVADFDTDLAEEFLRAVANTAKLTRARERRGGHERTPHGRGVVQGVRAGAARGRLGGPAGAGRALHQGPFVIAILDYGMGNLRSVAKALEHVGAEPVLTSSAPRVREAEAVVLPGVGAMPKAMTAVRSLGLDALLRERVEAGVPVLGLCMGMQLLFEGTEEHGGAEGIGLLRGRVERLRANGLKVPQIGWNPVAWRRRSGLNDGLPDPCAFYHANSFAPRPSNDEDVLGVADYGGEFVSVVERPPVYGLQSHPEKSGPDGLRLLRNFVSSTASLRGGPSPPPRARR